MESSAFSDPKLWVSILAFLASGWSAFNSWQARRIAKKALAINESQEARRQPKLGIYRVDGYRRYLPDKQLFGFMVSVSNPTDINNAISQAELQVTYVLEKEIKAVWRVPHSPAVAAIAYDATGNTANVLTLPLRVDAHQTVAGWLVFSLDNSVLTGRTIDSHQIILEDSHSASTTTEAIAVREWKNESQKN